MKIFVCIDHLLWILDRVWLLLLFCLLRTVLLTNSMHQVHEACEYMPQSANMPNHYYMQKAQWIDLRSFFKGHLCATTGRMPLRYIWSDKHVLRTCRKPLLELRPNDKHFFSPYELKAQTHSSKCEAARTMRERCQCALGKGVNVLRCHLPRPSRPVEGLAKQISGARWKAPEARQQELLRTLKPPPTM